MYDTFSRPIPELDNIIMLPLFALYNETIVLGLNDMQRIGQVESEETEKLNLGDGRQYLLR